MIILTYTYLYTSIGALLLLVIIIFNWLAYWNLIDSYTYSF